MALSTQRDREDRARLPDLLTLNFESHRGRHNNVRALASRIVVQWLGKRDEIVGSAMLLTFDQNVSIPIL